MAAKPTLASAGHRTGGTSRALSHQADALACRLPVRERRLALALRLRVEGREDPWLLARLPTAHDLSRGRNGRHRPPAEVPLAGVRRDRCGDHAGERQTRADARL